MERETRIVKREPCCKCDRIVPAKRGHFCRSTEFTNLFQFYCDQCFRVERDNRVEIIGLYLGCSRCKRPISEGDEIEFFRSHGSYFEILCFDCFRGPVSLGNGPYWTKMDTFYFIVALFNLVSGFLGVFSGQGLILFILGVISLIIATAYLYKLWKKKRAIESSLGPL